MDAMGPMMRTLQPTCTGTSIIGIVYDQGVLLVSDTVVSYGKSPKYKGVTRQYRVNDRIIVAFTGDHADFHMLQNMIERQVAKWSAYGQVLNPKELHSFLSSLLYAKRSRMEPLWNTLMVAGWQGDKETGQPFLGIITPKGVAFETRHAATGIGSMLLNQLIEDQCRDKSLLTREKAEQLGRKAVEIGFYLDCTADNQYEVGVVERGGASVKAQKPVVGQWDIAQLNCQYE